MSVVLGFDSRYTTTIPEDTEYQFAGIKISQGVGGGPYSQPLQQWPLAKERGLARLPFHFWSGANTQDPESHGREQAAWFRQVFVDHFGDNEIVPCIDAEDIYAHKGLRSLNDIMACLKETEDLWGIPRYSALLYSAGWWWDQWIKPYTSPSHEIYQWKIWEADPPPETPIGYWSIEDSVIVQIRLDFQKAGFNASIDENIAQRVWYLAQLGEPTDTVSLTLDRDVALALKDALQGIE